MFKVHLPILVKVSALNPVAYNPRNISPTKYEALKESIRAEGFVDPLVVQKKGMNIIGGHARFRAVKELAIEASAAPPDLPCTVLDIDDVRAKKLNLKLNNARGENDARLLGELLVDLYDDPALITVEESQLLGFEQETLLDSYHLIEPRDDVQPTSNGSGKDGNTFGKSLTLSIEFDSVTSRDRVKKTLAEQAKVEKKKTGDVVLAMLFPKKTKMRTKPKLRSV